MCAKIYYTIIDTAKASKVPNFSHKDKIHYKVYFVFKEQKKQKPWVTIKMMSNMEKRKKWKNIKTEFRIERINWIESVKNTQHLVGKTVFGNRSVTKIWKT